MRRKRRVLLVVAALLPAIIVPLTRARAAGPCEGDAGGGSWVSYGHDLTGSRHQPAEYAISADNASTLQMAWHTSAAVANSGASTPVVAGRCIYVAAARKLSGILVGHRALVLE